MTRISLNSSWIVLASVVLSGLAIADSNVDIDAILRRDGVMDVKISPTGEYLAATMRLPDRTALAVIRRTDGARTANVVPEPRFHIGDFHWVSDERLLMMPRQGFNQLEDAVFNGEILGMNADNSLAGTVITGLQVRDLSASRVGSRNKEAAVAGLVDHLGDDARRVIVSISPLGSPYSRAELVDSVSGQGAVVAKVAVPRAVFTTDAKGVVRFAVGVDDDNHSRLYHRKTGDAEWQLINDHKATGLVEKALGFSADNAVAYLQVETANGPDAIIAFDPGTGERKKVFQDARVDPWQILRGHGFAGEPVGVMLMDGKPRTVFFDNSSEAARIYRTIEAALPGQGVMVTSTTKDGRLSLVKTFAGNSPGDFYVFDRETKRVEHIISIRDWLEPAKMAKVEPVRFTARDGQSLDGYVTRAAGSSGPLPTVVLVHRGLPGPLNYPGNGNDWGVDSWQFNDEVQMLAQAGYAVLQVNHRGSDKHGQAFRSAAAGKWGSVVAADLADATRWAIAEGIADGERVCVYGSRQGGYAALMAAALDPGIYRCAAANAGSFNLAMLHRVLSQRDKFHRAWITRWLGPAETLEAQSATVFADRIRASVFLTGYGEGTDSEFIQFKSMRDALESAGVSTTVYRFPNALTGDNESRGRREHYSRLLAFLADNLGGAKAKPKETVGRAGGPQRSDATAAR